MDITENIIQVNKFARRNRHMKVFSKKSLFKIHFSDLLKFVSTPIRLLGKISAFVQIKRFLASVKLLLSEIIPVAPQKRLMFQAVLIGGTALVLTSLSPGGSFTAVSMTYSSDYISAYSLPGDILVSDDNGYLIKINPPTDESNRIGMTDYAVHTIESGETLSVIAQRYGVSVDTIKWENDITNENSIRSGQQLMIPPVDGISYSVQSTDSLEKIADKYEITSDAIIAQNGLDSETINKGQELFLPGAEPITPVVTVANDYRVTSVTRSVSYANVSASTAAPAAGKVFIYPSRGSITNGYHAGHYAIDIADRSKPPVWAAGSGKVTKASTGTWGGGYGNHVVIDHGGGLQTLYAHLDSVNVYVGQVISQGEVIGIMGNTGRVYGVTGIHLHWEVIQDGVKQYPGNYY